MIFGQSRLLLAGYHLVTVEVRQEICRIQDNFTELGKLDAEVGDYGNL